MMTNLFSIFDPCTGMLSMNWISLFTFIIVMPLGYWNTPNKNMLSFFMMIMNLQKEIYLLSKDKNNSVMMVSLFTMIIVNNLLGLFPYVFTASTHINFSMSLALSMWLSLMIFGWTKKTNDMFCHLVPTGTPMAIMPFMVLIESISNVMRPGSLAVRLSANMIAGHLLMSLLGNSMMSSVMLMALIWLFMGLMLFELAVAFIQAYVFMTLSSLYSSEI